MKRKATAVTVFFFLFAATAAHGKSAAPTATCQSTGNADWSLTTTWNCGHVPAAMDDVVVNHAVALNTDATILSLTVNGTLTFDNSANHVLTVSGNVTINSGGTINTRKNATHALTVGGDFTDNGSFDGYQNGNRYIDATFNGTGQQVISGSDAPAFHSLTINSGARVVFPAANLPTVNGNGTLTVNTGGAVQQTQTVNGGPVALLQISTNKYRGVDLAGNLGSTAVIITTTLSGGCTTLGSPPNYATRCYSITPANNVTATVRLWALTATQLNGIPPANLRIYRYTGGDWQQLSSSTTGTDGGAYSYGQGTTTGFSAFLLGDAKPTVVTLSTVHAQPSAAIWSLPIGLLLALGAILLLLRHRAR